MNQYPSVLIEKAVQEISRLPGIGKKSALRIALFLLKKDENFAKELGESIIRLRTDTQYCKNCGNISDAENCAICTSPRRNQQLICVVEDTRDVLAIENTGQFNGVYHVLGGVISPLDGIGPDELRIDHLINRLSNNPEVSELLLALSPTMEGDTTAFYISKKVAPFQVKLSSIARGIPVGGELEYADEITLGRSIAARVSYSSDTSSE